MITHKRELPKSVFRCDQCMKTFSAKNHLDCHKYSHSLNGFSCHLCPMSFTFLYKLETHVKHTHPRADKLPCQECGKELISTEHLKMHMKVLQKKNDFVYVAKF